MMHKIKNLGEGQYEYRGQTITRNDDVPSGYWGRWTVGFRAFTGDSRSECIKWIDRRISEREAKGHST